MIDSISSSSKHLYGGSGISGPYVSPNDSVPMHGVVRYTNQQFQVYNGSGWIAIPGTTAPIGMTGVAEQALDWAINKMAEEQRALVLAKTNPTVADALNAVAKAEEQLKIVVALVE